MKGRCMSELVNYNEAYQCFQKVIEMRPMNYEVFMKLYFSFINNKNIRFLYFKAYYYRGLVRAYMHQQNCIQDFNRALSINSNFFEAYLARAAIYGIENRHAKAILNCNEALKLNSKCVRGFLYR
jgi:tetratricopeptide (TPR) repeat protein